MHTYFARLISTSLLFIVCLFASTHMHANVAEPATENSKPVAKFDTIQEFQLWLKTVHNFNGLLKYKFHNWLESAKTSKTATADPFQDWLKDDSSAIFHLPAGTAVTLKFIVGKGWIFLTTSSEIESANLSLSFKTDELFMKKMGRTLLVSPEISAEDQDWVPFDKIVNQLIRTAFLQHTVEDGTEDLDIRLQLP